MEVKHKHKEGLMVALENNELKIKSTELVEVINEFRKLESETANSKYVELRHNDFMTKIKKELEVLKVLNLGGERNFSQSTYISSQNKVQPCFELNRDGMLQMLNSESTLVRYKTIEYINTMENKIKGQATPQLKPLTTEEMLELQFKYAKEVKAEVIELKDDFNSFKEDLPLIGDEPDELVAIVRSKGTQVLGGKDSLAYKDKSLSRKIYSNIWKYVKEQFNVKKYKAIKRKYLEKAKEIVQAYEPPFYLKEEIIRINNQINFEEVI